MLSGVCIKRVDGDKLLDLADAKLRTVLEGFFTAGAGYLVGTGLSYEGGWRLRVPNDGLVGAWLPLRDFDLVAAEA